ncbi:7623_t:CDS:10 [Ambispora gerdemannii]|uniref:7623_t:CDS:1 n=1 Tax=Ambispora gerdemannii TaxID=144530 RepID=A0A9N8V0E6_9GLOM|nr:7623_t:CDS:10 [Ambispora gerdemannii]
MSLGLNISSPPLGDEELSLKTPTSLRQSLTASWSSKKNNKFEELEKEDNSNVNVTKESNIIMGGGAFTTPSQQASKSINNSSRQSNLLKTSNSENSANEFWEETIQQGIISSITTTISGLTDENSPFIVGQAESIEILNRDQTKFLRQIKEAEEKQGKIPNDNKNHTLTTNTNTNTINNRDVGESPRKHALGLNTGTSIFEFSPQLTPSTSNDLPYNIPYLFESSTKEYYDNATYTAMSSLRQRVISPNVLRRKREKEVKYGARSNMRMVRNKRSDISGIVSAIDTESEDIDELDQGQEMQLQGMQLQSSPKGHEVMIEQTVNNNDNNVPIIVSSRQSPDFTNRISSILCLVPQLITVAFIIWFIYQFASDVNVIINENLQDRVRETRECSKKYYQNRAEVSAVVIGKVLDRLIEQLSYKTMIFLGAGFTIFIAILIYFRSRNHHQSQPQTVVVPPLTPHHLYSMAGTPLPITPMNSSQTPAATDLQCIMSSSPVGQLQHYSSSNAAMFNTPFITAEKPASYDDFLDMSALPNFNSNWVYFKGVWFFHIILILSIKIIFSIIPGVSSETSWTLTNLSYDIASFVMFHWVKGVPFDFNSGAYDRLTLWEQIDHGVQFTPAKKYLTVVPIGL